MVDRGRAIVFSNAVLAKVFASLCPWLKLSILSAIKAAQVLHASATETLIEATEVSRVLNKKRLCRLTKGEPSQKFVLAAVLFGQTGPPGGSCWIGAIYSRGGMRGTGFLCKFSARVVSEVPLRDSSREEPTNEGQNQIESPSTLRRLTALTPTLRKSCLALVLMSLYVFISATFQRLRARWTVFGFMYSKDRLSR